MDSVFAPIPLWARLLVGLVGIAGLLFGGYKVLQTVRAVSGATGLFIADKSTGCFYPEQYVVLKNGKEAGSFLPESRQMVFRSRNEAVSAGYRPCQN